MRYTTRPLSGWDGPRTPAPQRRGWSAFRAPWSSTLELLERELRHLDARDIALEADFRESDLRLDGMPRSSARQPQDPGVRLAFESKHGPLLYQCDRYTGWQANVRAIGLGLEALRAVDRYGITRHAEQYRGWRQIGGGPAIVPDAPMTPAAAAETLVKAAWPELRGDSLAATTRSVLDDAAGFRRQVLGLARRNAHPDTGGSHEAFVEVQRAIAVLRGGRDG